jgi:hypothetical protein
VRLENSLVFTGQYTPVGSPAIIAFCLNYCFRVSGIEVGRNIRGFNGRVPCPFGKEHSRREFCCNARRSALLSLPRGVVRARLLGLIAAAAMAPAAVCAVPECKTGTLQSYIDLGSDGCSIGSVVVFDFGLDVIPAGSKPILLENLTVKPARDGSRPRLEFSLNVKAGPGEFLDGALAFAVSGTIGRSLPDGLGARLEGATAQQDGSVTVIHSLCPGDEIFAGTCFAFFFDNQTKPPPSAVAFVAGGEASRSVGVKVAPIELMGVEIDIGVDGGVSGSAALQTLIVFLGSGSDDDDEQGNQALARGEARPEPAVRAPLAWLGRGRRTGR